MRAKIRYNNFELRSGYFSQLWLWWIYRKIWYFFLVLFHKSEVSNVEPAAKKPIPWRRRSSTTRIELNQPETHSLDVSHCCNFNAEIEKYKYPNPSYARTVKFSIGICSLWNNVQTLVTEEKAHKYRGKTFLKHTVVFRKTKILMDQS